VYAWRNIELNTAHEQLKLHNETAGIVVLQNTFMSATHAWTLSDSTTTHDLWVQGNLFIGPDAATDGRTVDYSGGLDDAVIDGNGWYSDGRFDFDESGDWSSFAEMQKAGVFETHGVLLDATPFASGLTAPKDYTVEIATDDASLDPKSPAVGGAMALANVGGVVDAPDLGAQELGCEIPIYGVRPDGVDENDGPPKCGGGDDSGTDGTGGGETGGDDTMSDDSGTTGGDAGDGGDGGDAGGAADSAVDEEKAGCGCGTRGRSAGSMAIAACALLVGRRRESLVCHKR
jgi:hypothetical protein